MQNVILVLLSAALLILAQRSGAQPTVTVQPATRTNNVGDNAAFSVTATGSGTLLYKWQFNGVDIAGATTSTLNVLVSDTTKAGNYRVLVSDSSNLTHTSAAAVLWIPYGERLRITQWNFNSTPPDGSVHQRYTTPSIGLGTVAAAGVATANGFNTGGPTDPALLRTIQVAVGTDSRLGRKQNWRPSIQCQHRDV